MMELIHMTAAYSNAVILAVMPHVSQFAAKLDLPIQQPITVQQVTWSATIPYKDFIETGLVLTNHYWFRFEHRGFVASFRAPTNWFFEQEFTNITKYLGQDHMTTNEAISMARDTLNKLGYKPELTHSYEAPTLEGPFDTKQGHVPYCRVIWAWPKTDNMVDLNQIKIEINMDAKTLAGMDLSFSRTNHLETAPIKVDVVPELESDYRKRMTANTGKMFINTNAPARFPQKMSPPR